MAQGKARGDDSGDEGRLSCASQEFFEDEIEYLAATRHLVFLHQRWRGEEDVGDKT